MKLKELTITYNDYTFTNRNIPPKSYGGTVTFDTVAGHAELPIDAITVDQIMKLVSSYAARAARQLLEELNAENIANSASPLALSYVEETSEEVEEGEFAENGNGP